MYKLEDNIHAQPESLALTLQHQLGDGAVAIAKAAALLRSGNKIVITGMGASLFASLPLQFAFCALGLDAVAIEAGELLHYFDSTWNNSVVLMVSRSGESVEIAKLLERMKGQVPIIGVSNEPQSLLARSANISLHIASLQDQIVAVQTYTGTILVLHLLANAVAGTLSEARAEVGSILPVFATLVRQHMKSLQQWDEFLAPPSSFYLLARGASMASAYEGALLFYEVAKTAAVTMPVASFRHGPVEVVDPAFRSFVFAPQDATRELNLALADDLVRFGGQVRVVGPPPSGPHSLQYCDVPTVSASLAPLLQIVPLQAAAYRLAELRGIEPGSFRFAPQVATDEASFGRDKTS